MHVDEAGNDEMAGEIEHAGTGRRGPLADLDDAVFLEDERGALEQTVGKRDACARQNRGHCAVHSGSAISLRPESGDGRSAAGLLKMRSSTCASVRVSSCSVGA
jgi:hypothetical protein